ncbi:HEAT repeat domain-containing protein [Leptolyngbya cf. ectocarpi LEGE 11479]|uniref:HEAT repeat domain-containing protein n=1 Tax=Leptolyngbya cf. ectocarpi LEGE 11479 TaxID=1828722 RepID=A0A928ZXG2_LEPEC|nr:HEAT repeat domain-containing protein [Leptolyngbya ectocarpi]MBE9069239.1 HEAT repeat domain-containing protein [Leptolyngbya cf. ectocarpi LEGE 11479]
MALSAGVGVLIGLGLGSGVTALLMRRTIRRQDNALQQSLNRLNRIQADHTQELNAALAKMEADYEQQMAAKIERYQDTHQEHLSELQAEYEARIAVLMNVPLQEMGEDTALPLPADNLDPGTDSSADSSADSSNAAASATDTASADEPTVDNTFIPIPDPWGESSTPDMAPQAPAPVAETPIAAPSRPAPSQPNLTQTATELGKAAAINRKEAVRAVPQLGKLIKDNDADVRLAAVTALQDSGSIKAIPFLRQALRDSDNRIVAAASAALNRFKGAKKPAPKAKTIKKKRRR